MRNLGKKRKSKRKSIKSKFLSFLKKLGKKRKRFSRTHDANDPYHDDLWTDEEVND
jgi:hypothetical protein